MDMDGQAASVLVVGKVHKALEKLGIEHADNEVEAAVIVGYYSKERRLFFPDGGQFHFVRCGDSRKGGQVELFQPDAQAD